jgi:NADH-quinone oxidoreductase E subunit
MSAFSTLPGFGAREGHPDAAWTDEEKAEIEQILAQYPTKRSAVMPLLWKAQDKYGWLSVEVMKLVADTLGVPASHVLSVSTFYTMYREQPVGKYLVQVCHTLSCELAGCDKLVDIITEKYGIQPGETTPDGLFTLMRVECLAACGSAPMMQVNEDYYYELLTPQKVVDLLEQLKSGKNIDDIPRPEENQWQYSPPAS